MFEVLKKDDGFTLIEVITTIAILGIIVVPISSYFTGSFQMNHKARVLESANLSAQQVMERYRAFDLPRDDAGNVKSTDTVNVGEYTAKIKVEPYGEENYQIPDYQDTPDNSYDVIIKVVEDTITDKIILLNNDPIYERSMSVLPIETEPDVLNMIDIVVNSKQLIKITDGTNTYEVPISIGEEDPYIRIKVHCTNEEDNDRSLIINVYNSTSKIVKVDEVRSKKTTTFADITHHGKTIKKPSGSISDASHEPTDRNTMYMITVTIYKGEKEITKIRGLKTNEEKQDEDL